MPVMFNITEFCDTAFLFRNLPNITKKAMVMMCELFTYQLKTQKKLTDNWYFFADIKNVKQIPTVLQRKRSNGGCNIQDLMEVISVKYSPSPGKELVMDCLPESLNFQSYSSSCINLLVEWSWLFQHKNVDLLKSGILDSSNASYLLLLSELQLQDFNLVPQGFSKDEWPADLKRFISDCHRLKLNVPQFKLIPANVDKSLFSGMKQKKREEVGKMSLMVSQMCIKYGIKCVVDIGCGLGHIDRILHQLYNLRVLGIEMDDKKVNRAKEMNDSIDFIAAQLSEETIPEISSTIKSWLGDEDFCLIALHSCGDLSVHIGNLFDTLPNAKCQIVIPCCYHRSHLLPLSNDLKSSGLINVNLLRIASDTNAKRWEQMTAEQHLTHARSVLSRNIIQLFTLTGKSEIKKKRRHLLRTEATNDWHRCLEKCLERTSGLDEEKLRAYWDIEEWRIKQVESYTCLQVCLQGVVEALAILDIINNTFYKENISVKLVRLFDDISSPRSIGIVVTRK